MDRSGLALARSRKNGVYPEVALASRCRTDADGFISHPDVLSVAIGFRIDRDRAQPQASGSAYDAAGNFATVGDEYAVEHLLAPCYIRKMP
jgi:hypothetical protein